MFLYYVSDTKELSLQEQLDAADNSGEIGDADESDTNEPGTREDAGIPDDTQTKDPVALEADSLEDSEYMKDSHIDYYSEEGSHW